MTEYRYRLSEIFMRPIAAYHASLELIVVIAVVSFGATVKFLRSISNFQVLGSLNRHSHVDRAVVPMAN